MKILLIRFSSMGDIVLTSPALRLLKKSLNAEISFLTKPEYVLALRYNPNVEHIYTLSEEYTETIEELKTKKFDIIIDLHKNARSRRIRLSLSARTLTYKKRTIDKLRILGLRHTHIQSTPVAARYIDTLSGIGIRDDGLGLDFFIPDEFTYPNEAISKEQKNIAIIAGGTYVTKRIPVGLISEIVCDSSSQFQLLGGSDVSPELSALNRSNCYNGIGRLSWFESAAVIRDADIVITGDTGLMHVAAALQKPIIVIWGSTAPNFGFAPYYGSKSKQRFISVSRDMSCRPCSKFGRETCPKGHMNCLNTIEYAQVREAIEDLLR